MRPLEQGLSPALISKERLQHSLLDQYALWSEKINRQKMDIIINGLQVPRDSAVRPEIIASWTRSYKAGVDLFNVACPRVNDRELEKISFEKQLLIEIATPYINQLNQIFSQTRCFVMLTDENGVILQVVGRKTKISRDYQLEVGVVWNETTIGTCSHAMSLFYDTPIQVWGPEHYSLAFNQSTGSAAPIKDVFGNLVGTLTIGSDDEIHQNLHTLGMVVSMASAIQKDFQLAAKDELLNATFETASNAVICINKAGIITHFNRKAQVLLELLQDDLIGKPLTVALGEQDPIQSVLETGLPVYDAQFFIKKRNKFLQLRSALPIKDSRGNMFGCIVRFNLDDVHHCAGEGKPFSADRYADFSTIIGTSPGVLKSVTLAKQIARSDANVLILGDSGTGKEVFAQAIHRAGRAGHKFVAVNCAAIPRNLIESELFGYDSGAFTGARQKGKQGKIELANGGTLFLDEIGDMPLELQPVLLRVLEEKRVVRLGSNHEIPVNFRLIAASNKDLPGMVINHEFRQDLYYRLAVFKIMLPPLCERGEDILALANYFIASVAAALHIPPPQLGRAAELELLRYSWPGNVRQLENAMIHAVYLAQDGMIWPDNLPEDISLPVKMIDLNAADSVEPPALERRMNLSMREIEKLAIAHSLRQTENNVIATAKMLGMAKSTLYKKIKKFKLLEFN